MSFQLNDWYTASFHGTDDSLNQVVFRAAIPFDAVRQPEHLPRHAALRHLVAVGRDRPRRHHDLRPHGLQRSRGAAGARASRARCRPGHDGLTHRQVDGRAGAGLRQLVEQGATTGACSRRPSSRSPGSDSAPDVGLINLQPIFSYQLGDGRSLSLGNSALRLRHREVALGVADARRQLRPGGRPVGPQVAPERRGRLRLQGRLRQPEVDVPRRHRAAAAARIERAGRLQRTRRRRCSPTGDSANAEAQRS